MATKRKTDAPADSKSAALTITSPDMVRGAMTAVDAFAVPAITSAVEYDTVRGMLATIRASKKAITAWFDELKRPIRSSLDRLNAELKDATAGHDAADDFLSDRMREWDDAIEAAQRAADDAKRAALNARLDALAGGIDVLPDEACAVLVSADTPAVPVVPASTPAPSARTWSARVDDMRRLAHAVAVGHLPPECLAPTATLTEIVRERAKAAVDAGGVTLIPQPDGTSALAEVVPGVSGIQSKTYRNV